MIETLDLVKLLSTHIKLITHLANSYMTNITKHMQQLTIYLFCINPSFGKFQSAQRFSDLHFTLTVCSYHYRYNHVHASFISL